MPYKNKEDQARYRKEWHRKNYPNRKREWIEKVGRRRREMWKWFRELKSTVHCMRCPESDPVCLDFHHRDPTQKILAVSNMVNSGISKQKILDEISKCDCLCSNCHRKETARLKIKPHMAFIV